jgi:hypothetical protein
VREGDFIGGALRNALKNVKQELAQLRASLAETKCTFEDAWEEWQADKKTLEGAIVDMTAAERDLAEDRISRESDAQARVSIPLASPVSLFFFTDFCLVCVDY